MSSKNVFKWSFISLIIAFVFFIGIKQALLLIVGCLHAIGYYEAKKKEKSKT